MTKSVGFIIDPIENIKIEKDSSFAIMLAAQKEGLKIYYLKPEEIYLHNSKVYGNLHQIHVFDSCDKWFDITNSKEEELASLDAIFMRLDPPFNMEYLYLTYLLDIVERSDTLVLNKPQSIRDCNEKLFSSWFPQCCPNTLVSKSIKKLQQFLANEKEIVVKPLDGMGGSSIFYLHETDLNKNVILETITQHGQRRIIAQRYLPEVVYGDKRITLINGEPTEHAILRVPANGDLRGNLAAGGRAEIIPITERDRWLCSQISSSLKTRGLYWVGLDIIGDYITEINVTSPTCIRELEHLEDISRKIIKGLRL